MARASLVSSVDLCAPCSEGSQCEESVCAGGDANNFGVCTQRCTATADCPNNFYCTQNVCFPETVTTCPQPYVAPTNTFCYFPAANGDSNYAIKRACGAGLMCYGFPDGNGGTAVGVCVQQCSSVDSSQACKFGKTCCFGSNADNTCNTVATSANTGGGCFYIQDPGAGCANPDQSYCVASSTCLYTQTAAAAKCYATCKEGACPVGGTCATVNGEDVCCNANVFRNDQISSCQPAAVACRRELGVLCAVNNDCRLNLCLKNAAQAACSVSCETDDDCPGVDEDVNGDGIADGGSTCTSFAGQKYCWPKRGPRSPPACADANVVVVTPNNGCSCQAGPGSTAGLPWLAAALGSAMVRRLRKHRRH